MALTLNLNGGVIKGTLNVTVSGGTATSVVATSGSKSVSLTYNSSTSKWVGDVMKGTWTVTATKSGGTATGTVTVSAHQTYSLTLKFSRLPTGYVELEYIEGKSNDNCEIDTGYAPKGTHKIGGKFKLLSVGSNGNYIWYVSASSSKMMYFRQSSTSYYYYYNSASSATAYRVRFGTPNTSDHTYSCDYSGITFDGSKKTPSSTSTITSNTTSLILILSGSTSTVTKIRHYYFTIGSVVNMIPARRTSDSKLGMYDIVRNSFYAVTGTATAGPEV